jgi:hypothetical protein
MLAEMNVYDGIVEVIEPTSQKGVYLAYKNQIIKLI